MFSEDFIRKQCDEDYIREQLENLVSPIEDKPKFPDKDILDVAIEGAEILSSDDNTKEMLKNTYAFS